MNKKKLPKLVIICGFVFLFIFVLGNVYHRPYVECIVTITRGMGAKDIANLLANEELINYPRLFVAYAKLRADSTKLRPGSYNLNSEMSLRTILEKIVSGDTYGMKITIPEGFSCWQIANLLAAKKLVSRLEFLKVVRAKELEGYLFPATYTIVPGTKAEAIVQIMVEKFHNVFSEAYLERCKELELTQKQVLTLASIVEREAKISKEKEVISSVFWNRLKKGWLLESCATVQYVLGKNKPALSYQDLKIKSPYNTYQHPGLPPGPICNPGEDSIKAALYPVKSDVLFFVAQGDGTHKFSRYYKEHLKEKEQVKRRKNYL